MNIEIIAELLDYGEYLETLSDDNLVQKIIDGNSVQNWITGVVLLLGEVLERE